MSLPAPSTSPAAPSRLPSPAAPAPSRPRWLLAGGLAAWALLCGWCVSGFPPCVDLPAHGAQLQTLAGLLRGEAGLAEVYRVTFPWGYGLVDWLMLPLALATSGATAARVALWLGMVLFPLSVAALARSLGRSPAVAVAGLPLTFNLSYWYGLVPGFVALSLALFTLAAFLRSHEAPRRWLPWVSLLAAAVFFTHLVAFAALGVLLLAATLARPRRLAALRHLVLALGLPALLSLPKVWAMAVRAATPGDAPATEYALGSHLNWFFKNYRAEGRVGAVVAPLLVTLLFLAFAWLRRRREARLPAVLFLAALALYLGTPKTLSGIFLVSVRLPVLAGVLSLMLVDWRALPAWARGLVGVACAVSLGQAALFHVRFARAVEGLQAMVDGPPPGRHASVSVVGPSVAGSRAVYAEHLGQWVTATRGGVGHNFFADAEHQPVRWRPGRELTTDVLHAPPEALAFFETVFVFGEGPLPPSLAGWRTVQQAGVWRRLERPASR